MRRADWHARLTAWLAETAARPFAPGRHDCAIFAAGAVEAMTGRDLARGWRGYRTMREGIKRLRRKGFVDHIALARSHFPETDAPMPGDLAAIQTPQGLALGVVQGAQIYVAAPVGWALVPLSSALVFLKV